MPRLLTIKAKAERFPPIVCRLLARKRVSHDYVEAMSDAEICAASGLSMSVVKRLSWALDWQGVSLDEFLAFSRACGVDFDDRRSMQRNTLFLKRGNWTHITRSPLRQTLFMPIYEEWRRSREREGAR